jgi:hypothetical protein
VSAQQTSAIPPLPHDCGSWVIVNNRAIAVTVTFGGKNKRIIAPGECIAETFDRTTAEDCAAHNFEVVTALEWLQRVNARAKESTP